MPKDAAGRVVETGREKSEYRDRRYNFWAKGIVVLFLFQEPEYCSGGQGRAGLGYLFLEEHYVSYFEWKTHLSTSHIISHYKVIS